MKFLATISLLLGVLGAAPADRMTSLQYLVGTWTCTYASGAMHQTYTATYAYDMGGNWLSERDSGSGGFSDLGMFTNDPRGHEWTFVVLDSGRNTTIFKAKDTGGDRPVWHSVFPDSSMTETFDKVSPTKYTTNFVQTAKGKTVRSSDTCVKR